MSYKVTIYDFNLLETKVATIEEFDTIKQAQSYQHAMWNAGIIYENQYLGAMDEIERGQTPYYTNGQYIEDDPIYRTEDEDFDDFQR
jgi:hypothetical protein|tara:strand:- start:308 stop:568 length:261 start_codon:yes stop_codon:yes gene_type:complete